jgi:Domain of unknown function (DUF4276)
MSRVHILVEGQTEETFIRDVVAPHLLNFGIYLHNTILKTKRLADAPDYAGGVTSYKRFKNDLGRLLSDSDVVAVTTFLDFYGLPTDFPGRNSMPPGDCFSRVLYVENQIGNDINNHKFIPFLALHEFESLLFVEPDIIDEALPQFNALNMLHNVKNAFSSPEEINDSPLTAPSKRLFDIYGKSYQKPFHGPLITSVIGLDRIRQECSHFDEWLTKLENLAK